MTKYEVCIIKIIPVTMVTHINNYMQIYIKGTCPGLKIGDYILV